MRRTEKPQVKAPSTKKEDVGKFGNEEMRKKERTRKAAKPQSRKWIFEKMSGGRCRQKIKAATFNLRLLINEVVMMWRADMKEERMNGRFKIKNISRKAASLIFGIVGNV